MSKLKNVDLATARKMSEERLQVEIGKRAKYLREEFDMTREDAATFISGLLNMGVAMNDILERKKSETK